MHTVLTVLTFNLGTVHPQLDFLLLLSRAPFVGLPPQRREKEKKVYVAMSSCILPTLSRMRERQSR